MSDFYPTGYEPQETPSDYMKLVKGENRIRILDKPIIGYEFWIDEAGQRKPVRVKTFNEAVANPNSDIIKEFHAFVVWNYTLQQVQLLNITQKTIQRAIFGYNKDPDWGDLTGFDIVIRRTGDGLETEYTASPKPHKPMDIAISNAFKAVKIDSEQYFTGGHPIVRTKTENETTTKSEFGEDFVRDVEESLSEEKVAPF